MSVRNQFNFDPEISQKMDAIIVDISKDLIAYNDHFNSGSHQEMVKNIYPYPPYIKGQGWTVNFSKTKATTKHDLEDHSKAPDLSKQTFMSTNLDQEIVVSSHQSDGKKIMAEHTLDLNREFKDICKQPRTANEALIVQAAYTLLPTAEFEHMQLDGSKLDKVMEDINKILLKQYAMQIGVESLKKNMANVEHQQETETPRNMLSEEIGILSNLQKNLNEVSHPSPDELGYLKASDTPHNALESNGRNQGNVRSKS